MRFLALASCLFYASWDWRCLGLLFANSVVGYVCGRRMAEEPHPGRRRAWLLVSVLFSLGLLGAFKYLAFGAETARMLLAPWGIRVPPVHVVLPAGISFYTFTSIGYAIDVHRRKLAPCSRWLDYFGFVGAFPHVVAGPIVRGSVLLPQLAGGIGPSWERLRVGGSIFLQGLTKKLLVADRLATIAEPVFAAPERYSTPTVWLGVLAYSLQIYCDFSGYSDMAIGSAKMIGCDLPENFNLPYLSTDVADFWRRWHISLSTWFRDYVFLPLAYATGRRLEAAALSARAETLLSYVAATAVTMLACGLWHGAAWNFVLWGALHGAALAAHRLWTQLRGRRAARLPRWAGWLATQLFVTLTWVVFGAPTLDTAWAVLNKLLGIPASGVVWTPDWFFCCLCAAIVGHWVGANVAARTAGRDANQLFLTATRWTGWRLTPDPVSGPYLHPGKVTLPGCYVLALWLLTIFYFAPTHTSPFLYVRF